MGAVCCPCSSLCCFDRLLKRYWLPDPDFVALMLAPDPVFIRGQPSFNSAVAGDRACMEKPVAGDSKDRVYMACRHRVRACKRVAGMPVGYWNSHNSRFYLQFHHCRMSCL